MASTSRPPPTALHSSDGDPSSSAGGGSWMRRAKAVDDWLLGHKVVASATAASLISTFAGFPLDSLKSRLQSSREASSIPRLAAEVIREEGVGGLWRGFPLPLITISIVRTVSFTIYTSTKRILNASPSSPPPPEQGHNWVSLQLNVFNRDRASDVALTSLLAGGASGAVVCLGSAPFELVKVRRQLEYQIYRDANVRPLHPPDPSVSQPPPPNASLPQHPAGTSAGIPPAPEPQASSSRLPQPGGPSSSTVTATATAAAARAGTQRAPFVPPTTLQAVRMIISSLGPLGLYSGFRLHFVRDTLGTALYFAEYDVMRHSLGRKRDLKGKGREGDEQGEVPEWARAWLPKSLIPFLCGSVAGVSSWALIYPVDAIKTKAQQRALAGLEPRTPFVQFMRLVRGTDKDNPKPLLMGIARLYRGLGVSMIRSMLTHGLLWTIVDWAGAKIDNRPLERWLAPREDGQDRLL